MSKPIEREELFNWAESFHYKPDLVSVAYKTGHLIGTNVLDCWTMKFDTGDTVFIYGYPDEEFGLQFNGTMTVDKFNDYPQNYDSMVHRIEGIIRDAAWRKMQDPVVSKLIDDVAKFTDSMSAEELDQLERDAGMDGSRYDD